MIKISHLYKSYGRTCVLQDINLDFEPGKIHGIVGRNGSGKSVLFKCICGLIPYEKGSIFVDGEKVSSTQPPIGKIGALIETPGFLGNISGEANLNLLASLSVCPKERVRQVLKQVELDGIKLPVGKYSLGMKQRLGLAQAILEDCKIIILDEPMNSLDEMSVQKTKELIFNLKERNRTILMASHIKEDVEQMCDTVTYLKMGSVVKPA